MVVAPCHRRDLRRELGADTALEDVIQEVRNARRADRAAVVKEILALADGGALFQAPRDLGGLLGREVEALAIDVAALPDAIFIDRLKEAAGLAEKEDEVAAQELRHHVGVIPIGLAIIIDCRLL